MDFFREISDGDNVLVKIPKRDRHATDVRRLPCVIIQKGSGKQPTYKLLSEFGVLSKRYTASKLMLFPAEVKCGDASVKKSLRTAAEKVLKSNNIFCHCKGTCKTMSCRCCKEHVLCSSRCHGVSSESCKNKNCYEKKLSYKSKSKLHKQSKPHPSDFAVFGDIISFQNTLYKFTNTCPVDTWSTILRFLSLVLKNQENTSKLQHLLQMIEQKNFIAAKLEVANDNDIKSKKETIDFFGNEFDLMIKTYYLSTGGI